MLDDLKKTAAGGSARERFRLSIVVALCLLAGGGIYAATMLGRLASCASSRVT